MVQSACSLHICTMFKLKIDKHVLGYIIFFPILYQKLYCTYNKNANTAQICAIVLFTINIIKIWLLLNQEWVFKKACKLVHSILI